MARDTHIEAPEVFAEPGKNPAEIRARWKARLRSEGHRQCEQLFELGGHVCSLGLLREAAGAPIRARDTVESVGALAGLSAERAWEITFRNDGTDGFRKHTFSEIADVVEEWFR